MNPVPLYTSLLKRQLLLGIPRTISLIIIGVSILVILSFEQYWFTAVSVVVLAIARSITKKDDFLVEIIFDSVFESTIYRV